MYICKYILINRYTHIPITIYICTYMYICLCVHIYM